MATEFGWTWEYIDEYMTWPRMIELDGYWKIFPPIGAVLASFVSREEDQKTSDTSQRNAIRKPEPRPVGKFGTMEDLAREIAGDPSFRVR